jgi:hypothetical protein
MTLKYYNMLFHNLKRWTLTRAFQTTTNNKKINNKKKSMEANAFVAQPNPIGSAKISLWKHYQSKVE